MYFTGKEHDWETGLENFGARYDASAMGRFMSPDTSDALVLRAIDPQRWNMYAYTVNSPLSYTDPTGRDAAAVNFSGMVLDQGHEALLIIDKDGTTTFASFGPPTISPSDLFSSPPGIVTTYSSSNGGLPTVQFEANGLPTADSYKALANKLAAIGNVDPSTVRLSYFQTSEADTQQLKAWVSQTQQAAANGIGGFCWYNVLMNNCADFTTIGLLEGGALSLNQINKLGFPRPNSLFQQLRPFENDEFELMDLQKQKACVDAGFGQTCQYY